MREEHFDAAGRVLDDGHPRRRWGRILAGLVGVVAVGLLLGRCDFAGVLWGVTEDVLGPLGMMGLQIQSTEDTALGGHWPTVRNALSPLGIVIRQLQSTLGQPYQSNCG